MPDIGHVVVGLLAGRWYSGEDGPAWREGAAFSAVSLLPDLDLVGRGLGVSDASALGHRGALHSLAAAALVGLAASRLGRRAGVFAALVMASHGALDMLDAGNLGVAYLWPLTPERFFWPLRFLPGPPPGEHWLSLDGVRAVGLGAVYFLPLLYLALRRPGYTRAVRISVLLAALALAPLSVRAQGFTQAESDGLAGLLGKVIGDTVELTQEAVAGTRALALIKGDFELQRAAGRPARADRETLASALRSLMRARVGRLRFGRKWRPFPSDEAFAKEAETAARGLEAVAAGLGPVRGWQCAYDRKAQAVIDARLGPLTASGPATLSSQPSAPPHAGLERAFRFGPQPGPHEPVPSRDEASARWLDWAAGFEIEGVADEMRDERSALDRKKRTTPLKPDEKRLREAIRLWSRAAALEKGAPAADPSAEALAKAGKRAAGRIAAKYGGAKLAGLIDCAFEEAVARAVRREAERP